MKSLIALFILFSAVSADAAWVTTKRVDPMTDARWTNFKTRSATGDTLLVMCKDGVAKQLQVRFAKFAGLAEADVTWRVDDGDAQRQEWTMSDAYTVWRDFDMYIAPPAIEKLRTGRVFKVQTPRTFASFNLTGLDAAMTAGGCQ